MFENVKDAALVSNATPPFARILAWLATGSGLKHGVGNDCMSWGTRSNTLKPEEELPPNVSQLTSKVNSQMKTRMRTLSISTTKIKQPVEAFLFPCSAESLLRRCFYFWNLATGPNIVYKLATCAKFEKLCNRILNDCFSHIVCNIFFIATLNTGSFVSFTSNRGV